MAKRLCCILLIATLVLPNMPVYAQNYDSSEELFVTGTAEDELFLFGEGDYSEEFQVESPEESDEEFTEEPVVRGTADVYDGEEMWLLGSLQELQGAVSMPMERKKESDMKRKFRLSGLALLLVFILLMTGCGNSQTAVLEESIGTEQAAENTE